MSNRSNSSQHRHDYNSQSQSQRPFRGKSQKQHFIPRSNPKLSSSLRHHSNSNSNSNSWEGTKKVEMGGGSFVKYLPQDEAVAIGLGVEEGGIDPLHSQTVVDLLNAHLATFLKFKPRIFWHQVAVDTSLHEFLDCFLQFRTRWYDFPYHGPNGILAGVIVGDLELSRRVFMLLYRISSNKDPGSTAAMSLSQKDHQVLLQEKKLLDLPKLLDICAIYGHENEDLTRLLVWNAVNAQPDIHGRFTPMLSHFLGLVHTMYARCTSKLEALISTGGGVHNGPPQRHVEYLEVMDFINDAVVSMSSFVSAYRPAAVYFSCTIDSRYYTTIYYAMLSTFWVVIYAGK